MVGFAKNEILFDDDIIKYIIETYTLEAGVRKLKEKIIEIIRDINLQLYFDNSIILPINITKKYCDKLFDLKPKIKIKKIISKPSVGIVNGLYASTSGIGGITFIQAIKFPSDKFLELNLTGALGDVMKESMEYALKLAFSILSDEYKNKILEEKSNKKLFGIHLHCPEGAVKKDGPSAGAAITLVIYSLLTNIKINNEVALTGEIDLIGNITAIGGLQAKLNGAKNAGVKLALYPSENQDDIDKLRKENLSPEDANFNIIPVSHINEVINLALIN
jgi:ATP-dependent Lon protease